MTVAEVGIAVSIMAFIFAYLAVNMDKRHGAFQFLFLFMSLLTMTSNYILIGASAQASYATLVKDLTDRMYGWNVIFIIIVAMFFLLLVIQEILMYFNKIGNRKF